MAKIKVAINGFGRIGRAFFKLAMKRPELDIVAINELGDIDNLAYLLKYDSAYGKSDFHIAVGSDKKKLIVDGKEIAFVSEKDATQLPWGTLEVDIVVESTGVFASYEKAKVHLTAGAKRVVITAPVKDDPAAAGVSGATVLMGINEDALASCQISSNASCTTNAGSPLMQILHEEIGVERAMLSTVHGYTASQRIVDSPNEKDYREGRAGAANIIPSSTGAAIAVTQAIPDLAGKFDGVSFRVPILTGSIADITFVAKRYTSVDEINAILKKASEDDRWSKIFSVTDEPLVSSDIIGSAYASIADLSLTRVVDGTLVKVCAWYDNEMGYAYALVEHIIKSGEYI